MALVALVAVVVGLEAVLLLPLLGPLTDTALANSFAVLFSVGATVFCLRAAFVSRGRPRTGWLYLGLGSAAWACGEVIWTFYEVVLRTEVPFPSFADFAFVSGYPLVLLGILILAEPSSHVARLRTFLDAAIFTATAGVVLWFYVIQPIQADAESTFLLRLLSSSYPLGDVILLFGVAAAALRKWGHDAGLVHLVLGSGLGVFLAADVAFAVLSQTASFSPGSVLDVGWHLGYLLIGSAAVLQARLQPQYEVLDQARTTSAWRQTLPAFVLIPLAIWFALQFGTGAQSADLITLTIFCIAVALVSVRGILTIVDALSLNAKLAETHVELQRTHGALEARARQVNALLIEAVDLSRRDSLTGLLNRGAMLEELSRAMRSLTPFHLVLVDVDHMKTVNDTLGHLAGDAALLAVSRRLSMLACTTAGRYGGDEFLLLADATEFDRQAYTDYLAELTDNVQLEAEFQYLEIRISAGIATWPADGADVKPLLSLADQRLYAAKKAPRSTVPSPFRRRPGTGDTESSGFAASS